MALPETEREQSRLVFIGSVGSRRQSFLFCERYPFDSIGVRTACY
jgi:hypothetical protein